MINTDGKFFTDTLTSLKNNLKLDQRAVAETTTNASNIIQRVVAAYERTIAVGHVGKKGKGVPMNFRRTALGPTGLVYGRIQSGKTRAMITSTAMAFDNGFRVALVMTSNINDLVSQTHLDFSRDLVGVRVFTKDDELDEQTEKARLELEYPAGRILIVTSKGGKSLKNVRDFLMSIDAQKYPLLIFDDEGDQASLDTNTYKRSKSGDITLAKSPINDLIARMRHSFPACVYASVTGTPQSVLLQTASSDNRPSFINMLPAGNGYVGGDSFFATAEPQDNIYHLISVVPNEDKSRLLNARAKFPDGLTDSILFFLLAASAAKQNDGGLPDKGYQFLCHPSLKNSEQEQAKKRINSYLNEIRKVLRGHRDTSGITPALKAQHRILQRKLGIGSTPTLGVLNAVMDDELKRERILVINASNSKRRGIEYGPGFNFLVGGNTLGRGIAIPNLLVTYYVRQAVTSQMDTMHQHARMFGYRQKTLPYTQLFTTLPLYYRFCDIYASDQSLRTFIENHINDDPKTFPIDVSLGLNATRKAVLDVESVEAIGPGMQIYPNRMKLPQPLKSINSVWDLLFNHFNIKNRDVNQLTGKGNSGVRISTQEAREFLELIKTNSQNSWHDKTIQHVLTKLSQRLGNDVLLKYRSAERTILEDGLISSGTLSGYEQNAARLNQHITLWIMHVVPKTRPGTPALKPFMFPTIVVPNRLPRVFVFSKK